MPIETTNPTTGLVEKSFPPDDPATVERKIGEAQAAYLTLRDVSFDQRAEWMRASAAILRSDLEPVARLLVTEMGKPLVQARAEVVKCIRNLEFYAENAERFLADQSLEDPARVGATAAYSRYEPLGVVLAVMPWNYPLWQAIRFAAPALMAGNASVLKHASNVPQAALYMDTLFERGGFPAGSFRALLIGSSEVRSVIEDDRVVAVTLTGSEPAGRSVASIAAAQIKKSVLELGGSDPFVVMPSADILAAAATAVRARVQNNGQTCIASKRFLVHTAVYDAFVEEFVRGMRRLVVGNPFDELTDVGPMATAAGRTELHELVSDAASKGATVLTGGRVIEGNGWYYEPTVIGDLTDEMRIVTEETFGPVASVYRFADSAEAIRIANQTRFGLSSAIWTTDPVDIELFVRELDAGAVFVNGMSASYSELPFGGTKASGIGRELAAEGIREFCNLKTVWVNL